MGALQAQARDIDSQQPVNGPFTFEEILGFQIAQPRFIMALFSLFALLGLALAMAGIYSVLSYMVSKRSHEIGLRMALGAQRADVLRLIFKAGGKLVGTGIGIGVLAGLGVARILRSQLELFKVTATDPLSFLGVIVLLIMVALIACWIPARRAAKVDPMITMRYE